MRREVTSKSKIAELTETWFYRPKRPKSKKYLWLIITFILYSFATLGQAVYSMHQVRELCELIKSNATSIERFDIPKDKVAVIAWEQQMAPWFIGMFIPCIIASSIQILLVIPIVVRILGAFAVYATVLFIRFFLEALVLIIYPKDLYSVIPGAVDSIGFPIIYYLLDEIVNYNLNNLPVKGI